MAVNRREDGVRGEILTGYALHRRVVLDEILGAERFVWIATADLKDVHIEMARGYRPLLEELDRMAGRGVSFRIVHAKSPSSRFRDTLEGLPRLTGHALELQLCPRSHWKMIVVDGRFAYFGSANFTGAGIGARRDERRNLEIGWVSREPPAVAQVMDLFDRSGSAKRAPTAPFAPAVRIRSRDCLFIAKMSFLSLKYPICGNHHCDRAVSLP